MIPTTDTYDWSRGACSAAFRYAGALISSVSPETISVRASPLT